MLSVGVIVLLSYLAGSVPGSIWTGKLFYGVDLRAHGSGNAGATNTFRVLGWKAGVLATLIDVGKGLLAAGVIASLRIDPIPQGLGFWDAETVIRLLAGISAVAGHMYPVFAGFRGGKGANTSAGVLLAVTPVSMAVTLAVFAIVLFTSRYVSLASLMATTAFPITVAIRKYVLGSPIDASLVFMSLILWVAIFYAHRANIRRLLEGSESRVRSFKPGGGLKGRGEI